VNPSLTITAMAEHAMSQVPLKDQRAGLRHLPVQARAAGAGIVLPDAVLEQVL